MLIHATITVTGDPVLLAACDARLKRLLAGLVLQNAVTEHHGADGLCYDLKVEGGIPFPLFAQASGEFPDLQFVAEWVNVAAGESGRATLVGGRVTAQSAERMATSAEDDHPVHVELAPDGTLRLALTLFRALREEWRGYAVTGDRDALLRVRREPGSSAVEVLATDGAPEWALGWRGDLPAGQLHPFEPAAPNAIDPATFRELDAMARAFVLRWIWFAGDPEHEIAVEKDRYARYGVPVREANVRSARLHRLRSEAADGAPVVHSTIPEEERWIGEVVRATWGK